MVKTRKITINRTVLIDSPKKGGETEKIRQVRSFVVRINAGVPPSHRLCEENIQ